MQRRDFLLFRSQGDERVAELSCQQLFMHYQDLMAGFQQSDAEAGNLDDADWWAGEPSLDISRGDVDEFFARVLTSLKKSEKLVVRDPEWLGPDSFRSRLDAVFTAFRGKGGEVSFAVANADRSRREQAGRVENKQGRVENKQGRVENKQGRVENKQGRVEYKQGRVENGQEKKEVNAAR